MMPGYGSKHLVLFSVFGVILVSASGSRAESAGDCNASVAPSARLLVSDRASESMPGLEWSSRGAIPIEMIEGASPPRARVRIEGSYSILDSNLITTNKVLVKDRAQNRKFQLEIEISGPTTGVQFFGVDPYGAISTEQVIIQTTGWECGVSRRSIHRAGQGRLTTSLGLMFLSYQQSYIQDFSQTALTAKVSYSRRLKSESRWELGLLGFGTLMPLSSNREGVALRFLGLNSRIGYYLLRGETTPWRLAIFSGAYYTTTFSQGESIGYENLFGLQLFPTLSRALQGGRQISTYLKFAPVNGGVKFPSKLTNREFAVGLAYSFLVRTSNWMSLSLDWAQLKADVAGRKVESTSTTASLGYTF